MGRMLMGKASGERSSAVTSEVGVEIEKPVFLVVEKEEQITKPVFQVSESAEIIKKPKFCVEEYEEVIKKPKFVVNPQEILEKPDQLSTENLELELKSQRKLIKVCLGAIILIQIISLFV